MKEKNNRKLFKSMLGLYKPYKWMFLLVSISSLVVAATELIYPLIAKYIINELVSQEVSVARKNIIILGVIIIILMIIETFAKYIQYYKWSNTIDKIIYNDLQVRLYSHLQSLSFSWYDNAKTGELMGMLEVIVEQ